MENYHYFGVAFGLFDELSFGSDFLAGVRLSFFTGGCLRQNNIITRNVDGEEFVLVYDMAQGEPLRWKLNRNAQLYQNAEKVDECGYRVNTYTDNERVYKRSYFSNQHSWLKTEYFSEGEINPVYVLYPDNEGSDAVVKMQIAPDTSVKTYLYPSDTIPEDGDYDLLVYAECGFLYYTQTPNRRRFSKTVIHDSSPGNMGGFSFDSVDFDPERNFNYAFDITEAEYLTEENAMNNNVSREEPASEPDEDVKIYGENDSVPELIIESAGEQYKYFGDELGGKREGHGRTVTSEGRTAYEGEYKGDKRDGFGVFYYKDGRPSFVGEWRENRRNGFGTGFRGDGTSHSGKWSNNKPDGIGARFDSDGEFLFLGSYVDGKKQGKGISLDSDGSFVVSVFENDEVVSSYRIDDLLDNFE